MKAIAEKKSQNIGEFIIYMYQIGSFEGIPIQYAGANTMSSHIILLRKRKRKKLFNVLWIDGPWRMRISRKAAI